MIIYSCKRTTNNFTKPSYLWVANSFYYSLQKWGNQLSFGDQLKNDKKPDKIKQMFFVFFFTKSCPMEEKQRQWVFLKTFFRKGHYFGLEYKLYQQTCNRY